MKLGQSDPRNRVTTERTDRAVSPVIGVILMVAITVILAAVIGVFVLGLGDELGDPAPSNSIDIDYDGDQFIFSHESGDAVENDDLRVVVVDEDGNSDSESFVEGEVDATSGEEFAVGDTETAPDDAGIFDESGEIEISLVHDPSDSTIASAEFDIDS